MTTGQMALVVILPLYILDSGNSLGAAALVFAMRSLGSMAVNLPASLALARFGVRPVMLAGVFMIGFGALVLAISNSTFRIALATLVFGAGMGSWLLARMSYITQKMAIHRRGKAMSVLAGIQRLGMLVGPVAGGLGVQVLGYQSVFLLIAISAAATLIPIYLFCQPVTGNVVPDNSAVQPAYNVLTLAPKILYKYRKVFLRAGLFVFCLQFVREQRRLLITLWGASLGLDADAIGFAVSLTSIADMLTFPVAGYLMDNKGRKISGMLCIFTMALMMILLPFTGSYGAFLLVAMLSGAGNGLGSGIMLTLGADFAPEQELNQFLGVWRMFCDLGAMTGPLFTSIATSLLIAFNTTAVVGILGGIALWRLVEETLPKANPDSEE